jgi:hypothetical protein
MEPFARAVRKSSGLNIESGELSLGRSRESDGVARLPPLRDIAIDTAVPRRGPESVYKSLSAEK